MSPPSRVEPAGITPGPPAPGVAGTADRAGFALKVDVDTCEGLAHGVPRLLRLLERHAVRASFFIAMGPDRSGVAALRAFRQRGFLAKMIRSRAPSMYPWRTMLAGTLLPAKPIAASLPARLREIAAAGHEVGVHGWDHVRWHDHLEEMAAEHVAREIDAARELFADIMGVPPRGFAAPGWQCSASSLRAVDAAGFAYRSDSRGERPCRPVSAGYVARVPEIPTTLPTLDEVLGREGRDPATLAARYEQWIRWDALNVHTIHAEIEGGPCTEHLERLLARVVPRLPVVTLEEVAASLCDATLPDVELRRGRLPGRGGLVSMTGPTT